MGDLSQYRKTFEDPVFGKSVYYVCPICQTRYSYLHNFRVHYQICKKYNGDWERFNREEYLPALKRALQKAKAETLVGKLNGREYRFGPSLELKKYYVCATCRRKGKIVAFTKRNEFLKHRFSHEIKKKKWLQKHL